MHLENNDDDSANIIIYMADLMFKYSAYCWAIDIIKPADVNKQCFVRKNK